jgi:hypothetical protein
MGSHRLTTLLLAVCCLASGCAADEDGAASVPGDLAVADGPAAETGAAKRDACELLTAADVAAVHGAPVVARPEDEGPHRSSCLFSPPGTEEWQVIWLTVHWRGGREEWDIQQAGRGIAVDMMSTEEVDVDSITRPDPLAGIGDAAYYGGILPSLVLDGDVLLEFQMPLLQNDREHFPALARLALSRL